MTIGLREILLFIHILLGIAWLGGILFVGWGVYPAVSKLSFQAQRNFLTVLMKHAHLLLTLAGASVIATGIFLGTYLGPIKSMDTLISTPYGQLFLTALVLATIGLLWGAFVSYRVTMLMLEDDHLWVTAMNDSSKPLKKTMRQVTAVSAVEVVLLCIVVGIMVLM